ncbi:MAG TPA: DUF1206 domain-containing protein [Marmoricola sp.]|jgi:hypothetical protein|nr:DUF1206 domain-containing protein [Marmoricola sp.]
MGAGSGERAERSDVVDHAVQFGMLAYGLVYLVVAWIAGQLALGLGATDRPSGRGALHELAQQPLGAVLVWAVAVGMVLLVLWRLLEAVWGHPDSDGAELWRKRAVSVVKAAVYGALGWSALKVAFGGGSGGSSEKGLTAQVLSWPAGTWLVGAAGVAILAYAAVSAYRGVTGKVLEHLDAEGQRGQSGTAYELFGRVGYVAKGVALAVVGGLVVYAAVTHDPQHSGGLDEALLKIQQQAFGSAMLLAVAIGLACYGLFCFARARHLDR